MAEKSLVILLHGIGASGAQLMPLATAWRPSVPVTRFAAPDAPMHHWRGHQWFATDGNPLAPERIAAAREAFDAVITDVVHREGFDEAPDRVAFVGVSQGAIVALDAVASGRWKVGALVAFSGLLPPHAVSSASRETPVLLVEDSGSGMTVECGHDTFRPEATRQTACIYLEAHRPRSRRKKSADRREDVLNMRAR